MQSMKTITCSLIQVFFIFYYLVLVLQKGIYKEGLVDNWDSLEN